MTVASTPSRTCSRQPALGRIFVLARSVFALLGFGMALTVVLPQAREAVLNQFGAVTSQPQAAVALNAVPAPAQAAANPATAPTLAAILTHDPIQGVIPAAGRGQSALLKTGYTVTDDARLTRAVAQVDATDDARVAVTQYIAKRYKVADEVVSEFVAAAYKAGEDYSVDPLIVLAVMATESRYNPIAESVVGAKGLMQIIAKFHSEKLAHHGGEAALLEPAVNIRVGTQILREYFRRHGDMETALQMYAGALDDIDTRYARKVFAERARIRKALARSRREA